MRRRDWRLKSKSRERQGSWDLLFILACNSLGLSSLPLKRDHNNLILWGLRALGPQMVQSLEMVARALSTTNSCDFR